MASILGTLRVRLTAETEDFRRGLDSARQRLGSFEKDLTKFRTSTLAGVASMGALAAVFKSSIDVANRYDNAQRQLAATSKLTGVELGFLQSVSKQAQDQFRLSGISANGFTIELAKLAGKAGDVGKASAGLEAFLDIGAARGLSADQTLKAVQQSILGIDEGTDKLFSKNPSVLYAEYAKQIGTTAGKLTDQQKAQALLTAAMQDGGKVRGEYQKWLQSSQGQQYLLSQSMEQTQAVLGKALQPALVAIIPLISQMAEWVQKAIQGWQMLGATATLVPALIKAGMAKLRGNSAEARQIMDSALEGWREMIAEIQGTGTQTVAPFKLDVGSGTNENREQGRKAAQAYREGVAEEWENLHHSLAMMRLDVGGTDSQRLAAEEAHALKLLDIQEQHIHARHRLKELTDAERDASLQELNERRQIVQQRRQESETILRQNEEARAGYERQGIILDALLEREQMLGRIGIERLGAEGSITERLNAQLGLSERIYQMKRSALLNDAELSDTQRQNELLALDLAREREQLQLRMNAEAERERRRAEKGKDLRDTLIGGAANIGASLLSGNVSGGQVGSQVGSLGASMLEKAGMIGGAMVPVVGAFLPAIGGLLGGLFGRKNKPQEQQQPVIKGLEAVERAQRETITAIEAQTDALLNPDERLFNLPSGFNLPAYSPTPGGTTTNVTYGDTNVQVHMTVTGGQSPDEFKDMVVDAITEALDSQMSTQRW